MTSQVDMSHCVINIMSKFTLEVMLVSETVMLGNKNSNHVVKNITNQWWQQIVEFRGRTHRCSGS